ncbi:MAG: TIR domain-containing protein [Pyrinomonadaceae bacterium]
MCPVQGFDEDIFISYAHLDNQPLAEGLEGWVETLHERLGIRLAQLLGEEVKIWRDPKLQGNDYFADTLVVRVAKVAVLVSVLSPRYVKSEWCMREINEFCKAAELQGGLRVGNSSRLFKIIKTYIPLEEQPPSLQPMLGYEFYDYDAAQGRAKEFSPDVVPHRDIRYWEKLEDLANDLKQLIERMKEQTESATAPRASASSANPAGKIIYLAKTTSDLSEERDIIQRELQQRGHRVLPDEELPLNAVEMKEAVREYLKNSHLSIHLIGARYGMIPEDESRSIIQIQNDLAAERGQEMSRLLWMPTGLESQDERQQKFIDALRLGVNGFQGVEVLQTKLEDLKMQIYEKLADKPQTPAPVENEGGPVSLYLICDKQDSESVAPLESYLFDQGFEVILPVMEGDEAQAAQDHKDNLLYCDAVMIYYGQASEIWLRMKLRELQKIAGYGRTQPMLAKAIHISGPPTPRKDQFKTHEAIVIRNYGPFSPGLLEPFIVKTRTAKGAQ